MMGLLLHFFLCLLILLKSTNLLKSIILYPAIKIGRLAVHKDYQGIHIGSILLDWIVGFCLELRSDVGIRFISIDAYNQEKTKEFYYKNLFEELQPKKNKNRRNVPMYRDLCIK